MGICQEGSAPFEAIAAPSQPDQPRRQEPSHVHGSENGQAEVREVQKSYTRLISFQLSYRCKGVRVPDFLHLKGYNVGFRFDLETANWLAFVIEPSAPIPPLAGPEEQFARLEAFLRTFSDRFHSSPLRESDIDRIANETLNVIQQAGPLDSRKVAEGIEKLRREFRERLFTALIVPSGDDPELDSYLCSVELLLQVLGQWGRSPGLILQLSEPPTRRLVLNHIFPAFQAALGESSDWPGTLVWNRRNQAEFFPFGSHEFTEVRDRLLWVMKKLGSTPFPEDPNLQEIRQLYKVAFPDTTGKGTKLHILQISDIHLGSPEAGMRLLRAQQHIENLAGELHDGLVVPIVSGDLMDSPTDTNLDSVRLFFQFLNGLGTSPPLAVLGNHDVRKSGWLQRILGRALQVPTTHGIHWFDEARVGIACFNSVVEGHLARGFIGERQRIDMANRIDQKRERCDFAIVGVLHHHPIPVEPPNWLERPFYERFLGESFEQTKVLEDADAFVQYVEALPMAAVLHGHEHIPRIAETPRAGIPVFGCGSSVGKVKTKSTGETCISLNVLTLDSSRHHLTGRVLIERVVGRGLSLFERHAMIYRRRGNWLQEVLKNP